MNDAKYIGLDVHQATISVAVLDSAGRLVMDDATNSRGILNIQGLVVPSKISRSSSYIPITCRDLLSTGVSQGVSAEYRCRGPRMSRVNAHDRKTGMFAK